MTEVARADVKYMSIVLNNNFVTQIKNAQIGKDCLSVCLRMAALTAARTKTGSWIVLLKNTISENECKRYKCFLCLFTVIKRNDFLFLITGAGYHINKPNIDHLTGYPVKGWNSNMPPNGTKGK